MICDGSGGRTVAANIRKPTPREPESSEGRTTHSAAMRRSLSWKRFPDQGGRVGSVELVDRDDAGGRSDVELGQIARDHVDPHENQTAPCEFRADGGANLFLAGGEGGRLPLAADGKVRTDFARLRQPEIGRAHV